MKRIILLSLILSGLLWLLITPSCKKEKANPFTEDARQNYEAILSLQEECDAKLADFMATMDSSAAVEALAQWCRDNELVESVQVSSQGLSIKYFSGIWGGIVIDPKRDDEPALPVTSANTNLSAGTGKTLKNLPTDKTAIFMEASYDEFSISNDLQDNSWKNSFNGLDYFYDSPAGVQIHLDFLTALQNMGSVLCFDSHGYAWPADNQISEVYFKTGEKANSVSTEKYYQDILEHKIIILEKIGEPASSTYYISPGFITKYNDFSKDTVLFFGGFCYSYLGNWPSLAQACASGTYFGFDWIVRSDKCADWAIDLVSKMADQEVANPWTTEAWMSSSPIAKKYFDEEENKTVSILYNGNGGLTLWKPASQGNGSIISTSADGAPVTTAGFTCTDYTLKCIPTGQLPENLGYYWEYGDSTSYYTVDDNLALYHQWSKPQNYHVKVTITERFTGAFVMELNTTVSFVYPDFLPVLKENTAVHISLGPYDSFHFSPVFPFHFTEFLCDTKDFDGPLTWSDSSFSAHDYENNDYETITLEGNVSSDGRILRHCMLKKVNQVLPEHELILEITNYPVLSLDTVYCQNSFYVSTTGNINQTYVTRVEYKEYNADSGSWTVLSGVDWPDTELFINFLTADPVVE